MSADVNAISRLPGNSGLTVMVDVWKFIVIPNVLYGLACRMNRPIINEPSFIHFYFSAERVSRNLVEGSTKMGQPILHPVQVVETNDERFPSTQNGLTWEISWWDVQFHIPPPPPAGLFCCVWLDDSSGHEVRIIVSGLIPVVDIPLRARNGGYP